MINKKRFGSVISINPDSIGSQFPYEFINYIDISSINEGCLDKTTKLKTINAPSRAKRLVKHGDTILSTVRPNLRAFLYIKNPSPDVVVSTGFAVLRASDKIDSRFLYYTVINQEFTDYLTNNAKGSAYPAVDTETIARAEIPFHSLPIQRKIAAILSAYDDLIDINTRRIKILEEMVHAIYREWFINFRFPGHESVRMVESELGLVPEGWETKQISDIANLFRGRSYASENLVEVGGLPFLNLKCLDRDGGFRSSGIKRYQGLYKETQTATEGEIIIAVTDMTQERRIVAHAARIPRMEEPVGVFSMDLVKVTPHEGIFSGYLYGILRYSSFSDKVKQHANGVNVLHLNPNRIGEFEFSLASKYIRNSYSEKIGSCSEMCDILQLKNANLRRTRDLLLPKLISGELDVSGLDIRIPKAEA